MYKIINAGKTCHSAPLRAIVILIVSGEVGEYLVIKILCKRYFLAVQNSNFLTMAIHYAFIGEKFFVEIQMKATRFLILVSNRSCR